MGIDIDIEHFGDEPVREDKSLPPPPPKVKVPQLRNIVVNLDVNEPFKETTSSNQHLNQNTKKMTIPQILSELRNSVVNLAEDEALIIQQSNKMKVISQIVLDKKIPFLTHFTHIENLESIIENGIISRSNIQKENIIFRENDLMRLDGNLDFSSFSIAFPNDRMFYKYRRIEENNNKDDDAWVVLLINSKILFEKNCLFCHTNAASNAVTNDKMTKFQTPDALKKMFDNDRESYLKSFDPTDVQAEVMVEGTVEPKHIIKYIFNNASLAKSYKTKYPSITAVVDHSFFSTRKQARTIYSRT